MSLNNVNPSAMFGGSWQELTGSYIKLGGDGTIAHNCKTSCHVTVSNDGQNPCPTNCNYFVSNSDMSTTTICYTCFNGVSLPYYCENADDNWCNNCFGGCFNDNEAHCGNNAVGGTIYVQSSGVKACSRGVGGYTHIWICDDGCVGCVNCHSNTYYTCNSCNSACHSCNSHCANCYSNCHGSVGENFNIMYVHMWKRVG